jgi:hypothetical protein
MPGWSYDDEGIIRVDDDEKTEDEVANEAYGLTEDDDDDDDDDNWPFTQPE